MSTDIVIYKPKHIVATFWDESFAIDSEHFDLFEKQMESNRFIKIWDSLIAVSSIKSVTPADSIINILENLLQWESKDIQAKVRHKYKERQAQNFLETEWTIRNMIKLFKPTQND